MKVFQLINLLQLEESLSEVTIEKLESLIQEFEEKNKPKLQDVTIGFRQGGKIGQFKASEVAVSTRTEVRQLQNVVKEEIESANPVLVLLGQIKL
jgi:hypothetical protein